MKKILATLSLFILLSYSCEKIGNACYTCTTTIVTTVSVAVPGYPSTDKTVVEKCDWSASDAKKFEEDQTATATTSAGGVSATAKSTCKCVKN